MRTVRALYGRIKLDRAFCVSCNGMALVLNGHMACCDERHEKAPAGYQRMSLGVKRMTPSKEARELILKAQGNRCLYCERPFGLKVHYRGRVLPMTPCWDHMVPYSYGQDNAMENFAAACRTCNLFKSNLMFGTVEEARAYVQRRWERGSSMRLVREDPSLSEELAPLLLGGVSLAGVERGPSTDEGDDR